MTTPIAAAAAVLASAVLLAQSPPQYKVAVEYVEVEARVLDEHGQPLRHLSQDSFQLLEDGVAQTLTTLTEIDLPVVQRQASAASDASSLVEIPTPDVSSNAQKAGARTYLILVDDTFIAAERTPLVRRLLKQFVDHHIEADDLVAVSTTGRSTAFQNFTNDKALLAAAIDRLIGEKDPSPTITSYTSLDARVSLAPGGSGGPVGGSGAGGGGGDAISPNVPVSEKDKRILKAKSAQEGLLRTINWMADLPGRSKGIILMSEGVPLDELNDLEGVELAGEARRLTEASRHGGVPVYTVDPRGLTSLAEEAIQVGTVSADTLQTPAARLRAELNSSQEGLRRLAEDTGGIAAVGTNDFAGAFDRIVRQASSYYLLGYYSSNPKRDGKFRRIQVKVAVPAARILARSGYTASSGRPPAKASFPGPAGASQLAREALSSPQPMSALKLSASAAAFKGSGAEPSVAVILESSGADLALTERNGAYTGPLEVLVAALESRGSIKASETKELQFTLPPATFERVQRHGFRWLSRLSIKPGTYQIRIAAVSGAAKQGTVWYDLVVPDFSGAKPSMSGVLIASASAFQTPTLRPDRTLDGALPGPPTTMREFPVSDELTAFAEVYDNRLSEPRELDVTVAVRTESGREVFRKSDAIGSDRIKASRGVYRSITPIALHVLPGKYVLTIEAHRQGEEAAIRRAVPFSVRG